MEIRKCDQGTWVGARDTCVSKNYTYTAVYCSALLVVLGPNMRYYNALMRIAHSDNKSILNPPTPPPHQKTLSFYDHHLWSLMETLAGAGIRLILRGDLHGWKVLISRCCKCSAEEKGWMNGYWRLGSISHPLSSHPCPRLPHYLFLFPRFLEKLDDIQKT